MAEAPPLLTVRALSKSVPGPRLIFAALDLEVRAGEAVAVVGESGVGKSTLLNILAGLDDADDGTVAIEGVELGGLDEATRTRLRRERIGFVSRPYTSCHTLRSGRTWRCLGAGLARRRRQGWC